MRSFKSNENIHKKEGGSYYVVSANKASSVTLQSPSNESQRKHQHLRLTEIKLISIPVVDGVIKFAYYPFSLKFWAGGGGGGAR